MECRSNRVRLKTFAVPVVQYTKIFIRKCIIQYQNNKLDFGTQTHQFLVHFQFYISCKGEKCLQIQNHQQVIKWTSYNVFSVKVTLFSHSLTSSTLILAFALVSMNLIPYSVANQSKGNKTRNTAKTVIMQIN